MKTKNILIVVLAVILTGSVVFLSVWLSKNWDNVKKALNGTNIYTQTDIDNAYSDGYTTGLADKAKLTAELADAKSKLADAQDQLAVLTSENADLTADKASLKESLDRAVAECDELKSRISYLEKLLESYGNIEKISVSYWVDDECVNVELIDAGTTVTGYEPTLEDWQIFQGWALKDSTDVLNLTTTTFSSDTALYVVYDRQEYIFTEVEFYGLTEFNGNRIWSDGENTYYSYKDNQYVLDKETNTWVEKEWNGLTSFNGFDVWTDNTSIYYSHGELHYVLDISTSTWSITTWVGWTTPTYFYGSYIWTDGTNVYYSYTTAGQYVLDKDTKTWSKQTWNGFTDFERQNIWTDGVNIYCAQYNSQYVLKKETNTWVEKEWDGLTSFNGNGIWTDGTNIYYSNGDDQYLLDKETNTWISISWHGGILYGFNIWTDGVDIYYSKGSQHLKLIVGKCK